MIAHATGPPQPDFVLNSKSDLLVLLRRNSPTGGLPVKKLRESWAGVTAAIEELEREGRVLVTRTGKNPQHGGEGQMKMVFLDDIGRERDPLDQGKCPHCCRGRQSTCRIGSGGLIADFAGARRVQGPVALAQDSNRRRARARTPSRCVLTLAQGTPSLFRSPLPPPAPPSQPA